MRTVMLVEDEELILHGLLNLIEWESLDMEVIHMANNGQEALSLLEKEPVDIIVSDISMPVMDGLEFLQQLRKKDERVRIILLTGYDEFEYARRAIGLDVEEYLLKPIDEERLMKVLKEADQKLSAAELAAVTRIDDKLGFLKLLKGGVQEEEKQDFLSMLPVMEEDMLLYAGIMRLDLHSIGEEGMADVLTELKKAEIRTIYLSSDSLFLLHYTKGMEEEEVKADFIELQGILESEYGIRTFISTGTALRDYSGLPECYREAMRLQKYQIIEGWGGVLLPSSIRNRQSGAITADQDVLRRFILKKDKEGAFSYIEDLFINNIKEDASPDDIYQLSIQTALILQEIKKEYKLYDADNINRLTEVVERIYRAEDLAALKAIFVGEIMDIIACINENDSQYTPVVKQIISDVSKNYREDMNLKTLSYKYNMNASYLGQIFQKEVGCTFAQYLSNTKNSIAKDLILNTNMRINDIAKEVGYPDTSYFYRKFKQCYGVSPASLRDMKKY